MLTYQPILICCVEGKRRIEIGLNEEAMLNLKSNKRIGSKIARKS